MARFLVTMAPNPGIRLGVYEVLILIGQGGKGSALGLAKRVRAAAKSYENAPVGRFPRRSEVSSPERR